MNWASIALYIVGVVVTVLVVFSCFKGGLVIAPPVSDQAKLFGYSILFLLVGVILGGVRDMFHAWAFADRPPHPPAAPARPM